MVGAVALVATGVGAVGALAAGTTLAAGTAAVGVSVGLGAGLVGTLSAVASGLAIAASLTASKPSATSTGSPEQFSADPDGPIPYLMGEFGTSGSISFRRAWDTADKGDNDRQAFVAIISGGGPTAGFQSFTVDEAAVTFNGSGQAIGAYSGWMWMTTQVGAIPTATALGFGTGAGTPPGWGSNRYNHGLAAAAWTLRFDTKGEHYKNGVPAPKWVWRGVLCYDPRKDSTYPGGSGSHRWADPSDTTAFDAARATWEYSTNPYLHGLKWALGVWERDPGTSGSTYVKTFGIGMPKTGVDMASFVEGANIADVNGWKVAGVVYSADPKWETLKKILQAGMGEPLMLGAKVSCFVNAPKVSLATVGPGDVIGAASCAATQPRRDRINRIVPRYYQKSNNWQLLPGKPVSVPEYYSIDLGQRTRTIDYPLVASDGSTEKQIAVACRYDIENAREFGPIVLPLKLRWIGYKPGDCITVNMPEIGLVAQPVLLTNRSFDPAACNPTFTARSETAAKHPYALGQTTTPPPTPGVSADPLIPVPGAGAWTITATSISSGSNSIPALKVTGAVDSPVVEAIFVEYRAFVSGQDPDVNWTGAVTLQPGSTETIITAVKPQTAYEVAISYRRWGATGGRTIIGPSTTGNLTTALPAFAPGMAGGNGDFVFRLDMDSPTNVNAGEIYVTGSRFYHPDGTLRTSGLTGTINTNYGEGASGRFYIVYSQTAKTSRFSALGSQGTASNLFIARPKTGGGWEAIDNTGGVAAFTPLATDAIVAMVDAETTTGGLTAIAPIVAGASGIDGSTGPEGPAIVIDGTDDTFVFYDGATVPASPASITVTATPQGVLAGGTVSWSVSPSLTMTGSGNSRTIAASAFGNKSVVKVTATIGTVAASFLIGRNDRLSDGYLDDVDQAISDSSSAIAEVSNMYNDGIVTKAEKKKLAVDFAKVQSDYPILEAKASALGLPNTTGTERKNHTDTFNALSTYYLTTTSLTNMGVNTAVNWVDFQAYWGNYNAAQTALAAALHARAAVISTWSGTSNDNGGKPADNAGTSLIIAPLDPASYTVTGNQVQRVAGTSDYDTCFSSPQSLVGGNVYASARINSSGTRAFFGICNSGAVISKTNAYTQMDWGVYFQTAGNIRAGGGLGITMDQSYSSGSLVEVTYNGRYYQFFVDGVELTRSDTHAPYRLGNAGNAQSRLFGSIHSAGGRLYDIQWMPLAAAAQLGASLYASGTSGALLTNTDVVTASGVAALVYNQGTGATANTLAQMNPTDGGNLSTSVSKTQLLQTSGRALNGQLLNSNNNFGLRSAYTPPSMSDTDNTGTVTLNLGSSSYVTDWGATITFPSASIAGLAYSTKYYVWRNQADPTSSGTSYGTSTSLTDTVGTSKAYIGFFTTRASGSGSSGSGGTGGGGSQDCVSAAAYVLTSAGPVPARSIKAGDVIIALDEATMEGAREVEVEANSLAENEAVTLITESGIRLTLAFNTPITLKGGRHILAANAWHFRVPVQDGKGFRWERVVEVRPEGQIEVSHITAHGCTFAAGNRAGRFVFTHNFLPQKP